jgi:hypothetical protein
MLDVDSLLLLVYDPLCVGLVRATAVAAERERGSDKFRIFSSKSVSSASNRYKNKTKSNCLFLITEKFLQYHCFFQSASRIYLSNGLIYRDLPHKSVRALRRNILRINMGLAKRRAIGCSRREGVNL